MDKKLSVLVSGTGSLLEAMIQQGLHIDSVFADRECRGIEIANAAGVHAVILDRKAYMRDETFRRRDFTQDLAGMLQCRGSKIVAMAGFMTILSPDIFAYYRDRLLNIHPSLLPDFKGEHAVRDALAAGVKVTGTTVHIATEELDEGPILAQEEVLVVDGDTVDTLWERIKVVERVLYPKTIRSFAASF